MRVKHVFMEAATDGTGGGAGASGAAGSQGAAHGGSGQGAGVQGADEPSLLAAAAAAAAANGTSTGAPATDGAVGAAGDPLAFIPEKYRVNGADGKLDLTASAQKVAAAHAELEKKLGATGAAPATADEYKADAVLAKLKETTGQDVKLDDAQAKGFRDLAHGLKLSQAQYEGVLGAYFANVQSMVDASFDNAMAKGAEALSKAWGAKDSEPFKANMTSAVKAFMAYAPAEMKTQQVMDQIGNNPVVLQLLAAVGKEIKEDTRPNGGSMGAEDISALQNSEAYWSATHPDHQRVVNKVNAYYAAGGKNPAKAA